MNTDPILYWNLAALEANRTSHTDGSRAQNGPTLSSRALAIVHLAMYDAYFGVEGPAQAPAPFRPPYLSGLPAAPAGALAEVAVAGAAHRTLSTLFPAQTAFLDAQLAALGFPAGPATTAALDHGRVVADAMLLDRSGDPDAGSAGYTPGQNPGAHRLDPDNPAQDFHGAHYGARSKCFAVSRRHDLDPHPALSSDAYRKALAEVREKGIAPALMGTLRPGSRGRTPDETAIGLFWGYDGAKGLGTPPRLYNQIIRQIAEARGNSVAQNACLFALANTAMGDAGILAWEQKYRYNLWRPVVGIREDAPCMGPLGQGGNELTENCDGDWLPLGAPKTNEADHIDTTTMKFVAVKNFTPNFPAYPSGHATFGAAAFQAVRLFYNRTHRGPDDLCDRLVFVSEELDGVNRDVRGTVRPRHARSFPDGLWGAIEENGRSRVYLGVHWVFDAFMANDADRYNQNIGGVPLGLSIAEDLFAHGLVKSVV